MMNQADKADLFTSLHVAGTPIVLYNIWDAGSASAVEKVGAKAIASGSHGVANAQGYEDGELIPLQVALDNATRIVTATELPVTIDIETGYGETPEEVYESAKKVIATGAIGVNLEDQVFGSDQLKDVAIQAERITAVRRAADEMGINLFINARTDLFKNADPATHTSDLVATALERAHAFAEAGASGFFVPGLKDTALIKELAEKSQLPLNVIVLPGMDSNETLAAAGVARISYGPGPYLQMIEWLKGKAKEVY